MLMENKFVKNLIPFMIITFFLAGILTGFLNGQNFIVSASQLDQNSTSVLGPNNSSVGDYQNSSYSSSGTNTVPGNNGNSLNVTNSSPTPNETSPENSSANTSGATMFMGGLSINKPLLEQISLSTICVALGFGIIGMAFGNNENTDSLQMHRRMMTGAVAFNLIGVFIVMFPSLVNFYINPNVNGASSFSILQLIHAIIGFPAVTLALIFAFNDLPKNTKKWMHTTAILWLTSIALGAIIFFTIPASSGNNLNITYLNSTAKDVFLGLNSAPGSSNADNISALVSSPYSAAIWGIIFLSAVPVAWKLMHFNKKQKGTQSEARKQV